MPATRRNATPEYPRAGVWHRGGGASRGVGQWSAKGWWTSKSGRGKVEYGMHQDRNPPSPRRAGLEGRVSRALESVLARSRRMILSVGYRHGLDESDVDEVLQEVRVRIWNSHRVAEMIESLGPSYVYQTAASASVDILRRRRAARTGMEAVQELTPNLASHDRGPAATLEEREFADRIFAAVDQLPDARRAVVRMYLAGYGRREIAQALACAETRVRNLLHRGLVELRERLVREGIGPLEVAE